MPRAGHGTVAWTELNTWDPETSAAFLTAVLGWRIEATPTPSGVYRVGFVGDAPVGGLFQLTEPQFSGVPSHWLTYFAVDDADAACAAVRAHGGCVAREPFDVPGVARFAIVQDPTGAYCGYMTPTPRG